MLRTVQITYLYYKEQEKVNKILTKLDIYCCLIHKYLILFHDLKKQYIFQNNDNVSEVY